MVRRLIVSLLMALCLAAWPAQAEPWPEGAETLAKAHPSELVAKAPALMAAGRPEEATFWFYAGQLRWHARLAANPAQDPSGEPALFASLFETIGPEVNGWAFGDIPALQKTIDAVLAWDARYPGPSLPAASVASTRAGLVKLRDQIGREADKIRAGREAAGLPNR
ncbi:hypothetical protein [Aureimonas ureilytica]|uniref:hypothetical protein n=1 Tax=Aureimonas ureilytica TaxID=401562 RepID=UPI0003758167|nr:hypothetical protein [Aureimonas ureilytica]